MRRNLSFTKLWLLFMPLFGLWLFDYLPVAPPEWLTEPQVPDPAIRDPDTAGVLLRIVMIVVSLGPFTWADTIRLRGRFDLGELRALLRILLFSKSGAQGLAVVSASFVLTGWKISNGHPVDSYDVRINLLAALGFLAIIFQPPSADGALSRSARGNVRPLQPLATGHHTR